MCIVSVDDGDGMKNFNTICFGGNDWWYHNRNHFDVRMMTLFAKWGIVLYVNSIVMQKPNISQGRRFLNKLLRKTSSICRGLQQSESGFCVYSPLSLPVHHIAWLRSLNEVLLRSQLRLVNRRLGILNPVIWVACPAACNVALSLKRAKLVYQRTDRFEEYPNVDPEVIRQYDRKLKASADLTVFVNSSLYGEELRQCRKAICLDQGVDFDMFACAADSEYLPGEMRDIRRPIVGFFGGIDDHTSDIGLVEKVVDLLPEMSFVFVGKASSDTTGLRGRKNVWLLGQKPYKEICHYGKCFDVAIMPWRQNRWIEACNPVKLKEYLALGKPVVSTPFPELRKYQDLVYQARTHEEFAECIRKALAEENGECISDRKERVRNDSWESQAQLVTRELFASSQDEQRVIENE